MKKVFIVDDHPLVLNAIANLLTAMQYDVVSTASSVQEVDTFFTKPTKLPEIVFMDVSLNGDNEGGIKLTKKILTKYPSLKVVAFSAEDKLFRIKQLIDSGVCGYISKSSNPMEFDTAIRTVSKGEYYFVLRDNDSKTGIKRYHSASQVLSLMPRLSSLQMELLKYAASHYSYEEIATKMNRTSGSVEQLRKNLFTDVGVKTRQELVSYAINNGLL